LRSRGKFFQIEKNYKLEAFLTAHNNEVILLFLHGDFQNFIFI